MNSLGTFASSAYQTLTFIEDLKHQVAEREKVEKTLRALTNTLEERVRVRTEELEQRKKEIKQLQDQLYKENIVLREEIDKVSMFEEIVGTSAVLQSLLSRASKVAPADRADHQRNWHRQGTYRPRHPQAVSSFLTRICEPELRCDAARPDRLRIIWPREGRVYGGQRSNVWAVLNWLEAARSFSMKWESFLPKPRSLSCVFCKERIQKIHIQPICNTPRQCRAPQSS